MAHYKFDFLFMVGCYLLTTKLAAFCNRDTHFEDIPVEFFPVYSSPNLITTNHLNLCLYLPHLSTVSILTRRFKFKDFHGWPIYIFSLSCVATLGTSKLIQVLIPPMAFNTTLVVSVRRVLTGKTEGFLAILAIYLHYLVPHWLSGQVYNYL